MFAYLKQHPEVFFPVHKEPHFFGTDLTVLPGAIREEELYLELFAGAGDRPRVGESSVYYLASAKAPAEIKAFVPEAKILILLRNPVQAAYSLYSLYTRTGNEDLPTFEAALDAEPERRNGARLPAGVYFPEGLLYTEGACYAEKVARYLAVFGRENVHCVLFDDLVRDTAAAYRQTLEFLGLDPEFPAEFDPRKANERIRMMGILQLRRAPQQIRERMQFEAMKVHEETGRRSLPPEVTARLRERFAGDVAALGDILGRDLGAWTQGAPLPPI